MKMPRAPGDTKVIYRFRGRLVMSFDIEREQLWIGREAAECRFVPEDLTLMADFLTACRAYMDRAILADELFHIRVN